MASLAVHGPRTLQAANFELPSPTDCIRVTAWPLLEMPWQLNVLPHVADRLHTTEQGLLVIATDSQAQTATVVGNVPVTSGDFRQAVGERNMGNRRFSPPIAACP